MIFEEYLSPICEFIKVFSRVDTIQGDKKWQLEAKSAESAVFVKDSGNPNRSADEQL